MYKLNTLKHSGTGRKEKITVLSPLAIEVTSSYQDGSSYITYELRIQQIERIILGKKWELIRIYGDVRLDLSSAKRIITELQDLILKLEMLEVEDEQT